MARNLAISFDWQGGLDRERAFERGWPAAGCWRSTSAPTICTSTVRRSSCCWS